MNLDDLKKELEKTLMITSWSPTTLELKKIAEKLKEFKGKPTKPNISTLVLDVVDSYHAVALEGIDNSDLTTLLLLATKTVNSNDQ